MATNLGTLNGTTFNTANMKPAADEQIDTLWGQNLADNMARAVYRQIPIDASRFPSVVGASSQYTSGYSHSGFFKKTDTHNALRIEAAWSSNFAGGVGTTLAGGTFNLYVRDDTGSDAGTLIFAESWVTDDRIYKHDFDATSFVTGSSYSFTSLVSPASVADDPRTPFYQSFSLLYGSGASY